MKKVTLYLENGRRVEFNSSKKLSYLYKEFSKTKKVGEWAVTQWSVSLGGLVGIVCGKGMNMVSLKTFDKLLNDGKLSFNEGFWKLLSEKRGEVKPPNKN
jgi:hypothetical protein